MVWKWPSRAAEELEGAREHKNKAYSYSGGHKETRWAQTRKIKGLYFQLWLGKENVDELVLGAGRHIVRKVVG